MNKKYSIYTITNSSTGRVYVGCTSKEKPFYRMTEHMRNAFKENRRGYNGIFYTEVRKFGAKEFSFRVAYQTNCPLGAKDVENWLIDRYKSLGKGLNSMRSGGVASKKALTKRSKSNMGNRNAQGKRSREARNRVSKGMLGENYWRVSS